MAEPVKRLTLQELDGGLDAIRQSPAESGVLEMIVRRAGPDEREVMAEGRLDVVEGLVGDNWRSRGSSRTGDRSSHPDMQLTVMNTRAIALIAQERGRWALAGDQLFVDLDLSEANAPPGTRIALGSAIIEVTSQPHTGCRKFADRFGPDAVRFVNSPVGKDLRLRGINAKVVQSGSIRVGEMARRIDRSA